MTKQNILISDSQIDPKSLQVLLQTLQIPYSTSAPSGTPNYNKEVVSLVGGNYFYNIYVNGAWRTQQLGITQGLVLSGSPAQGDIVYFNGSNWVPLTAGTSGQFLKTLGSGANPTWDNAQVLHGASHTATTVDSVSGTDVIVKSVSSIPALGANGMLCIEAHIVDINNNGSTVKIKVGSTTLMSFVGATNIHYFFFAKAMNRNSNSAQWVNSYTHNGTSLVTAPATVDLSSTFQLDLVVNSTATTLADLMSHYFNAYVLKKS